MFLRVLCVRSCVCLRDCVCVCVCVCARVFTSEFQHVWLLFLFHDNGPSTPPRAKVCVCAGMKEHVMYLVCVCTNVRSLDCMRSHARVCKRCLAALICLQVCVCLSAHTHPLLLPTNELHSDKIKRTHSFFSDTHSVSLSFSVSLCRAHTHTHR